MKRVLMNMQQQNQTLNEENLSNLTSASCEASVSSNQQQSSFVSPNLNPNLNTNSTSNPLKKRRNLPGNPDPEAEVIALSPKTLMATNRFVCEVCNKGFQRDQNLQLHRRGHNLPWKLKQRNSKDIKKKVYICPEASCVHHDASRALGDLTGIKKHFSRKHGEKKWKCDKCSKKYAVQSDWKAHSKICGTREYRCDCGTLFSRRDSFITHRAFCDALAEESARANYTNPPTLPNTNSHPLLFPQTIIASPQMPSLDHQINNQFSTTTQLMKREENNNELNRISTQDIPPWLEFSQSQNPTQITDNNISAHTMQVQPSPHMSATALLQKAAQMGATMSTNVFAFGNSFKDGTNGSNSVNDGMTRDFLGLRALSRGDVILNMAGLDRCMSSSTFDQAQENDTNNKSTWNL